MTDLERLLGDLTRMRDGFQCTATTVGMAGSMVRRAAEDDVVALDEAIRRLKLPDLGQDAAFADVLAERMRQITEEGWTPEHDDQHVGGGMALAAACYAISGAMWQRAEASAERLWDAVRSWWPWSWRWWKPKDARRDLVRAGALIVAEIGRLDRANALATRAYLEDRNQRFGGEAQS